MKFVYTLLIIYVFASCNPVGRVVSEEEIINENIENLVYTSDDLILEKGDKLVLWGSFSGSDIENDHIPGFLLKYNLSSNDTTVEYKEVMMFEHTNEIINSTYKIRSVVEKESKEITSIFKEEENTKEDDQAPGLRSDWAFEQKVIEIPILKTGKYVLDYKIARDTGEYDVSFMKVGLAIRKH